MKQRRGLKVGGLWLVKNRKKNAVVATIKQTKNSKVQNSSSLSIRAHFLCSSSSPSSPPSCSSRLLRRRRRRRIGACISPVHNKSEVRYLYLLSGAASSCQYPAGEPDMCGRHILTTVPKCQSLSWDAGTVSGGVGPRISLYLADAGDGGVMSRRG